MLIPDMSSFTSLAIILLGIAVIAGVTIVAWTALSLIGIVIKKWFGE